MPLLRLSLEEDTHEQINHCDRSVCFDEQRGSGSNHGKDRKDGFGRDLQGHGREAR